MTELDVKLRGPFEYVELADTPAAPDHGLAIAAGEISREGTRARFRLHVAVTLPVDYAGSFEYLDRALSLVVRDGATGRGTALRFVDPDVTLLVERQVNFIDERAKSPSAVVTTSRVAAWAEAEFDAAPDHPGLLVYACLHSLISNRVVIPVGEA